MSSEAAEESMMAGFAKADSKTGVNYDSSDKVGDDYERDNSSICNDNEKKSLGKKSEEKEAEESTAGAAKSAASTLDNCGNVGDGYERDDCLFYLQQKTERKVDSNAGSVIGQADSVSNNGIDIAMKSIAKAMDQSCFPQLKDDDPQRQLVLIELNQVPESSPIGGRHSHKVERLPKTQINIIASNGGRLQFVLEQLVKAIGSESTATHNQFEVNTLFRDEDTKKLFPVVEAFVSKRVSKRKGVVMNNVRPEDIRAESAREPTNLPPPVGT